MALSDGWRLLAEALLGPVEFTAGEVAQAAGMELGDARRLWQALGLPPVADAERLFTPADVEALRTAHALIEQQKTDPTVRHRTRSPRHEGERPSGTDRSWRRVVGSAPPEVGA